MWIKERIAYLKTLPLKRYALYALLFLFAVGGYSAWLKWGPQPVKPGSVVVSAPLAKEVAKMDTKIIYVPRLVVIKEKAKAVAALKLPTSETDNPKEALLTATGIAANRYGATTAVFVNVSTGKARTDIVYKESPWFSLQRSNTVGIEAGYGMKGKYAQIDAEHEFAQVKGNFVAVKGSGTFYDTTNSDNASDFRIGVRLQRHFDWP